MADCASFATRNIYYNHGLTTRYRFRPKSNPRGDVNLSPAPLANFGSASNRAIAQNWFKPVFKSSGGVCIKLLLNYSQLLFQKLYQCTLNIDLI
jgi:hypothetical protein